MDKFRRIPGFSWVESKIKPIFDKVCDLCSKAWKKAQPILGKLWNLAKGPAKTTFKIGAKFAVRLVGFLVGAISAPPFSWILSLALGLWFLWDFFGYLIDNGLSDSTFFAATIYALIGWDILKKDKEAWESIEPLDEKEAKRVSNNITEKDIRKTSSEELNSKYSTDIKSTEDRIKTLKNKTVLYKDSNGNVLSLEESQKLQAIELQKQELQLKRDKADLSYKERLESSNWLDGEVELTPENSKKLVDYMYEKLKNDSFFDHALFGNMNINKNIEMAEKYAKSAEEAWKQGDLRTYADQMARAEIYTKMVELYKNGTRNETEAQKLLRSEKRFETFTDRRNQMTKEMNDLNSKLKGFTEHSVQSKDYGKNFTLPSSSNLLNVTGSFGTASTDQAAKAAAWSYSHYGNKRMGGWCAAGVREALQKGGKYNYQAVPSAYMAGPSLLSAGFTALSPYESKHPKIGDVAVIDKGGLRSDGKRSAHGHMAIATQAGWVSDGYQPRGKTTPNVYQDNPNITIYRDTGKNGNSFSGDSKLDNFITPNFPISNNTLNTGSLFNFSSSEKPTIIAQPTPQVPKEIESTLDLTDYWTLQV